MVNKKRCLFSKKSGAYNLLGQIPGKQCLSFRIILVKPDSHSTVAYNLESDLGLNAVEQMFFVMVKKRCSAIQTKLEIGKTW